MIRVVVKPLAKVKLLVSSFRSSVVSTTDYNITRTYTVIGNRYSTRRTYSTEARHKKMGGYRSRTNTKTTNMKRCMWADETDEEGGILAMREKWGGIGQYLYHRTQREAGWRK